MGSLRGSTVLVSGANGYLGARVVAAFEAAGALTVGFDVVDGPCRLVLDVRDRSRLGEVVDQVAPDVIVHLASLLGDRTDEAPALALDVNVAGTCNVLDIAASRPGIRVLVASSIAVYGNQEQFGSRAVNEDDHGRPTILYGWLKQAAEALVSHYRSSGLDAASVRIATLLGGPPRTGQSAIFSEIVYAARRGLALTIPYAASDRACLLHVDAAARIFQRIAAAGVAQHASYNTGGETTTFAEFVALLADMHPGWKEKVDYAPRKRRRQVWAVSNQRLRDEFDLTPETLCRLLQTESEALAEGA